MKADLSYSQLQAVIETAVEGIISINQFGIIKSVNPAAMKIFGYDSIEVINKNIKMLMPQPYRDEHDEYVSAYNNTGEAKIIGIGREVVGQRKDGTQFPMWLSVAEFFENEDRYFAGFISDLTKERENLQRAKSFENIFQQSLNEIYLFDAHQLSFIHVNQSALNNLQYSLEEIKTITPVDINPNFGLKEFNQKIQPLKDKQVDKIIITTLHQRKDQSCYPVEVHLEMSLYESKLVFVAVVLDITERINAKEKERINQEQLAHMDRISTFGEMAAGIAHEINQPLTAIGAYSDAGKRRLDQSDLDKAKIKELFDKIDNASNRASDVIKRLRMMLRPQSQNVQHLDMKILIQDAVDLAKVDKLAKQFDYKLNLTNDMPAILGDLVQLQQVIINLIRNAIDAALSKPQPRKEIVITSEYLRTEDRVKVSIRDYGTGIDNNTADNLFTPFHTTKEYGMGIGLSICESIINSHNGRLWFENNTDEGVTFHFTVLTELSESYD